MPNIYYNPEHFGLEIVAEIGEEHFYDFDILAVWKDKEGNLYYGDSSGCSCPSPFEEYDGVESLYRIEKSNFDEFERKINEYGCSEYADRNGAPSLDRKRKFIEKVKSLL